MIKISDGLLAFLIPGLQNYESSDLESLFTKTQLEIISVEPLESRNFSSSKFLYTIKPICNFCDLSRLWVLAQEIATNLEDPWPASSNFPDEKIIFEFLSSLGIEIKESYSENLINFLGLLLGEDLTSPLSCFLISDFYEKHPNCKEKIKTFLNNSYSALSRASSKLNHSSLLPIFRDLNKNWSKSVIRRLEKHHFHFEEQEDSWIIIWPPWYSQGNLPSFFEILARLIPLDQRSKTIEDIEWNFENLKDKNISSKTLKNFKEIRDYLKTKGFVECITPKMIKKEKNLATHEFCLSYNKELTLRDNLHYSLVFEALLSALKHKNEIYPVFELSYCPWTNNWLLGIASVVNLKYDQTDNSFWYNLSELKSFVSELYEKIIRAKILFERHKQPSYISQLSAALIYNCLTEKKEVIGQVLVHRIEQFEVRKKEIISVSLRLPL